jgi:hypothetical protein
MNLFLLIKWIDSTIILVNKEKIKRLKAENKMALGEVKRLDEECKNLGRDLTNLTTAMAGQREGPHGPVPHSYQSVTFCMQ